MSDIQYLPDPGLEAAVQVALELGMPLLVTGEPGTGKTQAAYWAAKHLGYLSADGKRSIPLQKSVLRFNTKTTSVAKDLFYRYDAIRHFRASRIEHKESSGKDKDLSALQFVSFEALGKAILAGTPERRFVVLIDEIDKAPRDFPNDVLFEFEDMAFRIEEADARDFETVPENFWATRPELLELGVQLQKITPGLGQQLELAPNAPKPLLILTSNSEKNLPDAFLRRCVFYHIPFPENTPEGKKRLTDIVTQNVRLSDATSKMLDKIILKFLEIRKKNLRKPPATAELISWVRILEQRGIDLDKAANGDEEMRAKLLQTYPILAKNQEDYNKLTNLD
ncbi:MAG TPA: AAA family ATPase [Saprospiraceae bacterium]|nr:AAA family ATPase [Saprospiraceae bacterium]